jgi:catalase
MATPSTNRSREENDVATQVVDVFNAIFGVHPGFRAVHAKGIVCQGVFRPAAAAAAISRAAHLQAKPVPVTVRFSDSPGVPTVPDGDANAGPRGMAVKFHLPGGAATDIVTHSYNGFPVATVEEFLAFIRALAASGPGAPAPTPLDAFLVGRPGAQRFLAPKPVPASFAAEAYYGVNAFRFINREGTSRPGRYQVLPVAGVTHLSPQDAAARPADFLFDELRERLSRGPAEYRLVVQLAADGDPVHDGSIIWPADRPVVELGTLSLTAPVADSAATERKLIFDPIRLTDGIELSDDPLPAARSKVYSVSYERRNPTPRASREDAA